MENSAIDIGSKNTFPGNELSNFAAHRFVFDNVVCESMEGLLQAFKESDAAVQVELCKLVGIAAKREGRKRNAIWQANQTLWWKGWTFDRHSAEFQELLDRAFEALTRQNHDFRRALIASSPAHLIHTIGESDPRKTILTEDEFCSRLMKMREQMLNNLL